MKKLLLSVSMLVGLSLCYAASGYRFDIHADKTRFGMKLSQTESTQTSEEKWGYHISVQNLSFKDIPGAEIRYIVFVKAEKFGDPNGSVKSQRKTGSKPVENFQNNAKVEFDTEPIDMSSKRLNADWYYASGAKREAKTLLEGVWVRVYDKSGEVLGEFTNPESLASKEKWK